MLIGPAVGQKFSAERVAFMRRDYEAFSAGFSLPSASRTRPSRSRTPRLGRARQPEGARGRRRRTRPTADPPRLPQVACPTLVVHGSDDDVVRETRYNLWIGDEAWEVDHFLHENPELKTAPYAS